MTSSLRRFGHALWACVALGAPLLGACLCSPEPTRPSTERCGSPVSDFTGVASVELVDPRAVNGIQGGSHFQFQIRARGTGLSGCVAQSSVLTIDGVEVARDTTAVRADLYERDTILTWPIYLFPPTRPDGVGHLRVETLGRTLELDVSLDPYAPPPDASTD